jgi:chromosome segregation ATPase
MDETKALGPEVRGLFDKVKQQAHDFAEAFRVFETEKRKFEEQCKRLETHDSKMKSLADSLRMQVKEAILQVNKNADETLRIFEHANAQNLKLFKEMENVSQIKQELAQLQKEIKSGLVDITASVDSFRQKSKIEIDSTISQVKTRIDKMVEGEIQKLELRNSVKLRQYESKFLSYDQKLWALNDSQSREIRSLLDDIDSLKRKFTTFKNIADEIKESVTLKLGDIERRFSTKFDIIDKVSDIVLNEDNWIEKVNSKMKEDQPQFEVIEPQDNEYIKEIDDLRRDNRRLESQIEAAVSKSASQGNLAAVSIAFSIFLLILVMLQIFGVF